MSILIGFSDLPENVSIFLLVLFTPWVMDSSIKGHTVEILQSHCIHTQFHWSSGPPICFMSWGTRVQPPGGYLCETGIFLLALSLYNTVYVQYAWFWASPWNTSSAVSFSFVLWPALQLIEIRIKWKMTDNDTVDLTQWS
jgi:hypothetical protein